jgi:hypothetical protein
MNIHVRIVELQAEIDSLRASHDRLLVAAKNAADYCKGGQGTQWKRAPVLHALESAIASADIKLDN